MTRYLFSIANGTLHAQPLDGSDLTSLRLALQVGISAAAPFVLALATDALAGQSGAGLLIGGSFGMMLLMRTSAEAGQMDREHSVKVDHAAELSRIEIREREALLPRRQRASQPRPAIQRPVDDPADDDRVLLAEDVRAVFNAGIKQGAFGRNAFIKTGKPRMKLPSGDELTRPRYEMIVHALFEEGLLVKGLDGAPTLPGAWQDGRQGGGQSDMPIIITERKRVGAH